MTGCIPLVLNGPLMAGFHIACIRKLMSGKTEVGDLFKAFNRFGATLLACLVISVFTFLGSLLCVIPGLIRVCDVPVYLLVHRGQEDGLLARDASQP